jgi:chromate reductase, NAD(P)H dehydrogenase (quinone)
MANQPKIIALAGSLRKGSFNKKLVNIAADGARQSGAEVTIVDLLDFPLPLYDGDLEEREGIPELGRKLKQMFIEHDGFLFSAPEYNSSITGVFKNTIDWISRPEEKDSSPLIAFKGKTAALMSASPSWMGGIRGLVHVRSILGNIGVLVLPDQVTVPNANEAFDADKLKDPKLMKKVLGLGSQLTEVITKLKT